MRLLLAFLALLLWPSLAKAQGSRIAVSLVASTAEPRPGSTITLGLRFVPKAGWHGYWTNPGDSGLAPAADWSAPKGMTFGTLQHPAPTILSVAGITSYVHAGEHVLLTTVRVPASLAAGEKLPVRAALEWLACSDTLCVPERATVEIELTAGRGVPGPGAATIRRAQAVLPRAVAAAGQFAPDGGKLRFLLPSGLSLDPGRARFFPHDNGFLDAAATRLSAGKKGNEIIADASGKAPATISGVLADGRRAYQLRFMRAALPAPDAHLPASQGQSVATDVDGEPVGSSTTADPSAASAGASINSVGANEGVADVATTADLRTLILAIIGAIVGGLLLNLMPCVFPILSLKALSLARSGASERAARREALGYTAGALIGTGLLGVAIVLLRQAGVEVGWSFQLQSPVVILGLLLLTFGIALNLAGLFELPAVSVESRSSSGSIATGALAAFIATPCSGPFMAAALGTAMLLPAAGALLVFLGLGLGLALPFLIIGFVPASRKFLPKPGAWMGTFRRILAIPMLLTAVALLWLVGRQGGTETMTVAVLLLLLLATGLWWVGLRQHGGRPRSWLPLVPSALAIALILLAAPPNTAAATTTALSSGTEPFSEQRLAELRRAGTPVFVDFTADWCLTCKINERVAIDRALTQAAFKRAGVVTLEGDWTNGDPAITRFLAQQGRNSIPFYLFIAPGRQPDVLPQILTVDMLRERAEAAAGARASHVSAT